MFKEIFGSISTLIIVMFLTGCFASLDTIKYWNGADKGEAVQTAPCSVSLELPALKIKEVIIYDWDVSLVNAEGQKVLDKVAKLMKENPDINLQINGYASVEGVESYNQALSQRRVDGVKVELMLRGIKSNRMTTEAKGETSFFGDLLDLNRRTEISSVD